MVSNDKQRALPALFAMLTLALVAPANAQTPAPRVVPSYGKYAPIEGFAVQPDPKLEYRVLFSVSEASGDADKTNGALERVARFVNLLGAGGVRPKPGDLVAIVYGDATPIIAQDTIYAAKTKPTGKSKAVTANPNIQLIKELQDAGVTIAVCRQALAGRGIEPDQVLPGVRVDASAITTIATLQLQGWAYIPD